MPKDLHITARLNKGLNQISYYKKNGIYIGWSIQSPDEFIKSPLLEDFIKQHNLQHHDSKPRHPGNN